jgi:hypothetical protein
MLPFRSDPYRFQRLALLATEDSLPLNKIRIALQNLSEIEQQQLLALIIQQGLQFFWLESLRELSDIPFFSAWRKALKEQCFKDTTRYLAQKKAILELDSLFTAEKIPQAIFKGAHIREAVYPNPAYRPSVDIDILVSPIEKFKAVQVLCAIGYALFPDPANVSHEVSLSRNNVNIDLHWHIMRPGRTRIEITDIFLQSRKKYGFLWGLNSEEELLILLTHPVFTKYSTTPQSSLVRLIDLKVWIKTQEIDWNRLLTLLQDTGLQTAAWITIKHLSNLTECRVPPSFLEAISPKDFKRFLLNQWLDLNLSSKFADYPIFAKYIFTLLAHNRLTDVFRFIRIYKAEQQIAGTTLEELQQASTCGQSFSMN